MQSSTDHLFLQSDSMFNDQEEEENYFRGRINEIESRGLTGLEIKGKVRTLSPVLFYQTNTRYLIMSNNELKYLPAGKSLKSKFDEIENIYFRNWKFNKSCLS
jgi:hypothetical protein